MRALSGKYALARDTAKRHPSSPPVPRYPRQKDGPLRLRAARSQRSRLPPGRVKLLPRADKPSQASARGCPSPDRPTPVVHNGEAPYPPAQKAPPAASATNHLPRQHHPARSAVPAPGPGDTSQKWPHPPGTPARERLSQNSAPLPSAGGWAYRAQQNRGGVPRPAYRSAHARPGCSACAAAHLALSPASPRAAPAASAHPRDQVSAVCQAPRPAAPGRVDQSQKDYDSQSHRGRARVSKHRVA